MPTAGGGLHESPIQDTDPAAGPAPTSCCVLGKGKGEGRGRGGRREAEVVLARAICQALELDLLLLRNVGQAGEMSWMRTGLLPQCPRKMPERGMASSSNYPTASAPPLHSLITYYFSIPSASCCNCYKISLLWEGSRTPGPNCICPDSESGSCRLVWEEDTHLA